MIIGKCRFIFVGGDSGVIRIVNTTTKTTIGTLVIQRSIQVDQTRT